MILDEQKLAVIRNNPNVIEADSQRILYTDEFKRQVMTAYRQGESPTRIFRAAGLGPELIGHKRVERCIARWRDSQPQPPQDMNGVRVDENLLLGELPDCLITKTTHEGNNDMKVVAAITLGPEIEQRFEEQRARLGLTRSQAFEQAIRTWAEHTQQEEA
ncbi:hypothetical protein CSQ85_11765 [Bifidobacterium rousetti]|uniref:ribbon-helix-helix protein, CopG family n=1 Tax=Bifidobacterium rousetti TaxID=2045439 RepID=UPI00123B76D9|nr:ribbon-helix-helix protein, CopG family [Bifidobacterium rousetti]KAA8816096.1 hypothetical protein CSQ85_11765 [Bifidobacterium rousetti]